MLSFAVIVFLGFILSFAVGLLVGRWLKAVDEIELRNDTHLEDE